MSHLGGMGRNESIYWHYKLLYMKLPLEYQKTISADYFARSGMEPWSTTCQRFVKSLSKLEQLIYTNEIQGE